jgi:hypothetical protein
LGFSLGTIVSILILLYCGLGQKEDNKTAMWILSLLNQPIEEGQKDSFIRIGEREIKFNAHKEEEAKISLIEYSSENTKNQDKVQDKLEFKVELRNTSTPIEVKADIYDTNIDRGTRFYRKDLDNTELPQNTITIKEGSKEYKISDECNAGGGIDPEGKELTIKVEDCKIKDIETEEETNFTMELKLKTKEDRPNNAGVGIAESPKSKFFSTRRGCDGDKSYWICLFIRHAIQVHKTGHCGFPTEINGIYYCNVRYLYRVNKNCTYRWEEKCEGDLLEVCDPTTYFFIPPGMWFYDNGYHWDY